MPATTTMEFVAAFLASIGGATLLIGALSSWLGNLWANRLLARESFVQATELEALRAELNERMQTVAATLEARTHVSKAQFDLEFELYRELWKQIEALRARAIKIWVPLRDAVVAGTLTPQMLAEAQSAQTRFADAYQGFVQYYLSQSPFIAPSVKTWIDEHQHLLFAMNGICKMAIDAASNNAADEFQQVAEAQLQYSGVHATFADAIRERLASVAIIA